MKATWTALALTASAWLAAAGSASAASMSYAVTDLGWSPGSSLATQGQGGYSNVSGYAAPQVSDAGTVSIGTKDLGQIVGVGVYEGGTGGIIHDFLLTPTPTPEPSTLLVGLAGIGFLRARVPARAGSAHFARWRAIP